MIGWFSSAVLCLGLGKCDTLRLKKFFNGEFSTAQRLNGVRRQLYHADSSSIKIADVANHWGFWHLGQFAVDYRRLFGELPSEPLDLSIRSLGGPLYSRFGSVAKGVFSGDAS